MPIDTLDILGPDWNPSFIRRELPDLVLGLETTLQRSDFNLNLIGALLAGNSNGIAVADIATEKDIDQLTAYGDVVVMEGGVNRLQTNKAVSHPRAFHMTDWRFSQMFSVLISLQQPSEGCCRKSRSCQRSRCVASPRCCRRRSLIEGPTMLGRHFASN